jgi:hypothetical protein
MFAEEAKQERQVETEPTRDTAMNESLLSDGSFFAEETEHEQHIPSITAAEDIYLPSDMEDMSPATQKPRGTGLDILVRQSQRQTGNPGKMTVSNDLCLRKQEVVMHQKRTHPFYKCSFQKVVCQSKVLRQQRKGVADRSPLQGVLSPAATRRQHKGVGRKKNRKSR